MKGRRLRKWVKVTIVLLLVIIVGLITLFIYRGSKPQAIEEPEIEYGRFLEVEIQE